MCLWWQGRIHQIEYAMEAVKQGAATVGLKSKTHAILVALKVIYIYCTSCIVSTDTVIEYWKCVLLECASRCPGI